MTARWHRGRRRPTIFWPALLALVMHSSLAGATEVQHARGQRLDKGSFVAVGRRLRSSLQPSLTSITVTEEQQSSGGRRGLMQSAVPPPKRSLEEKVAHAAEVRAMKPDLLLKNLRIREQNTTEYIPEACAEREELDTTTCVPLQPPVLGIVSAASTTLHEAAAAIATSSHCAKCIPTLRKHQCCTSWQDASWCRAEVLVDGKTNSVQTAAECAAACAASAKCNAWQWCDDAAGCPTECGSRAEPLPAQVIRWKRLLLHCRYVRNGC